ncbi:MAG: anti-sigma factor antagonist [Acidobacteria bacterium]|nr:anti-sigma factor antagonist [Acidobacteriota bacterium]
MTQLVINERLCDGVVVLDLDGRIVIGDGSRLLHTEVARLLENGQMHIILDLQAVTHVDSSGIGELVSRHTTTRNAGGRLVLNRLPRKVYDLLRVTRLVDVFEIYDNEQAALSSFSDQSLC